MCMKKITSFLYNAIKTGLFHFQRETKRTQTKFKFLFSYSFGSSFIWNGINYALQLHPVSILISYKFKQYQVMMTNTTMLLSWTKNPFLFIHVVKRLYTSSSSSSSSWICDEMWIVQIFTRKQSECKDKMRRWDE
jgi:hypothetical protein